MLMIYHHMADAVSDCGGGGSVLDSRTKDKLMFGR